jgi:hypothetical protein
MVRCNEVAVAAFALFCSIFAFVTPYQQFSVDYPSFNNVTKTWNTDTSNPSISGYVFLEIIVTTIRMNIITPNSTLFYTSSGLTYMTGQSGINSINILIASLGAVPLPILYNASAYHTTLVFLIFSILLNAICLILYCFRTIRAGLVMLLIATVFGTIAWTSYVGLMVQTLSIISPSGSLPIVFDNSILFPTFSNQISAGPYLLIVANVAQFLALFPSFQTCQRYESADAILQKLPASNALRGRNPGDLVDDSQSDQNRTSISTQQTNDYGTTRGPTTSVASAVLAASQTGKNALERLQQQQRKYAYASDIAGAVEYELV